MVGKMDASKLRYISSDHVAVSQSSSTLEVRDRQDRPIGQFDGVLIDPVARHVEYLVVNQPSLFTHRRYALPIDPTRVDGENGALRVDLDRDDIDRQERFDRRKFREYSAGE